MDGNTAQSLKKKTMSKRPFRMGLEANLARSKVKLKILVDAWNPKLVGAASKTIQSAGPNARSRSWKSDWNKPSCAFGISQQPSIRLVEGAQHQRCLVTMLLDLANAC